MNYTCPKCNSVNTQKRGKNRNATKQIIQCTDCKKYSSFKIEKDYSKEKLKTSNILILDIETAPLKAFVWSRWKQNIYLDQTISEWFMLTWSAKWLFSNEVLSDKLSPIEVLEENDVRITKSLAALLNEADIVITHNGDRFDLPKIKSRLIVNRLPMVTPYVSIDTCKIAKRQFGFSSNKLQGLSDVLGFDGKDETDFDLWKRCMEGDLKALAYMEKYNKQDVKLLEDVYLELRPYIMNHPNVTLFLDMDKPRCTTCGSDDIYPEGEYNTQVNTFTTYRCNHCKAIAGRLRKSSISAKQKGNILAPVAK